MTVSGIYNNSAIANRSRLSCAHNTLRSSIGLITPVTLKSRLRVIQGHWKRNHWTHHTRLTISRVSDVKIWLRDHSRSLKLVPLKSLGAVSYLPSIVTMVVYVAVCEIFTIE